MADYRFYSFFVASKVGKTGLTVTVDAYSTAGAKVVDNQAATEVGGGVYSYTYTTATADDYLAIFKTADTDVDAQHISALASEEIPFIDAAISSRSTLAQADILSDATPFDGANIDAAISTRATPADLDVTATVAISATEAAAVASGLLALRAYNTFSQAVTSTSEDDLSAASSVWLAIKRNTAKADADSLIFIEETAGLTVLDGAAYATPLNGSLTVSGSAGDWTVTLKVEAAAMAAIGLRVGSYDAEIKYKLGSDVKILWAGAAILSDGVVRAIA
jgi:hypothetical protein